MPAASKKALTASRGLVRVFSRKMEGWDVCRKEGMGKQTQTSPSFHYQ